MPVHNVTPRAIKIAAENANLDAAILALQEMAGITDGGIASQHFSEEAWKEADTAERIELIRYWLHTEQTHELEEVQRDREAHIGCRVLSFDEFVTTKWEIADVSTIDGYEPEFFKGSPAKVYIGNCVINMRGDTAANCEYFLTIENWERESDNLEELERALYIMWAVPGGLCDTTEKKLGAFDLGHGWFAALDSDGPGTLTVRNPEQGQRIDLAASSVQRLRDIFNRAGA